MKLSTRFRRVSAALLTFVLLLATPALAAQSAKSVSAPAAQELEIRTYRNIPYHARFLTTGGSGEDVTFEIVQEPKHGTVEIDGAEFVYTPEKDRCGSDRFTYLCRDGEGDSSAEAEVTVTVSRVKSGVAYSDTQGSGAEAAAQYLAEAGIFTGTCLAGEYFFEPERTVTRAEFLAMTMDCLGMSASAVTVTGFTDDAAIPAWAKDYASAALRQGVVRGSAGENGAAFRAGDPITFREAAVMLDRALRLRDVDLALCFAGTEDDSWAAQAVGNLEYCSVLAAGSFGSAATADTVTRADAARMLASAAILAEEADPGLFSWLR